MRMGLFLVFSTILAFFGESYAQNADVGRRGYEIGPGDKISGRVLGEADFNFDSIVDDDGKIQVPFSNEGILASCKTEKELREIVTEHLLKYLRSPQISVNVAERNRPAVTVYGEITNPQRIVLTRTATLLEILSFAGGITKESNGSIQITRTTDKTCSNREEDNWTDPANLESGFPTKTFAFSALKENNPTVFPGDVILVQRFPPVYVVGEVLKPGEISIPEEGLYLMQALAMASGVGREARIKDIRIYRKKDGSAQPEMISIDIRKIRAGTQDDLMLKPFDIVDVGMRSRTVADVLLDIAGGSVRNTANTLPLRTF
jgi:polysaccharide export outer membrane protein